MRAITLLVIALVVGACASPLTSPVGSEPAGDDLLSNLTARGLTVKRTVQGDSGCPNFGLDDQAVRIDVVLADDMHIYPIYIFEWRDMESFINDGGPVDPGAHEQRPFDDCVSRYLGLNRRPVRQVESFPWRAYGPEWPATLEQALLDSLHALGGLP
jgi:hypothetical protein